MTDVAHWLGSNIHLGDWLGIAGILITITQITRVGKSVRQVRDSLRNASSRASVYNVLNVAPSISVIDHQLESAARHDDIESFWSSLKSFKDLAAELDGLLHQEAKHSQDARQKLQEALAQITAAKIPVSTSSINSLYENTTRVRGSVAEASVAVVRLTARLRSDLLPIEAEAEPGAIRKLLRRRPKDGKKR